MVHLNICYMAKRATEWLSSVLGIMEFQMSICLYHMVNKKWLSDRKWLLVRTCYYDQKEDQTHAPKEMMFQLSCSADSDPSYRIESFDCNMGGEECCVYDQDTWQEKWCIGILQWWLDVPCCIEVTNKRYIPAGWFPYSFSATCQRNVR